MERLVVTMAMLAAAAGCGPAEDGCHKDTDCKGDRVCVGGKCRDPAEGADAGADLVMEPDLAPGDDGGADMGPCTTKGMPAVSRWPKGYVVNYDVQPPCANHKTCVECLPGATGQSQCQWCGYPGGGGNCVDLNAPCVAGQVALANHWNGYCPEFCDQMDGQSCGSCANQPFPYNDTCSWCPETGDCFNERAAQVQLLPANFCAKTKAGSFGIACADVPPYCQ